MCVYFRECSDEFGFASALFVMQIMALLLLQPAHFLYIMCVSMCVLGLTVLPCSSLYSPLHWFVFQGLINVHLVVFEKIKYQGFSN